MNKYYSMITITSALVLMPAGITFAADIEGGTAAGIERYTPKITTDDIANRAVTKGKIARETITSSRIMNGQVKAVDIGNKEITTAKIAVAARPSAGSARLDLFFAEFYILSDDRQDPDLIGKFTVTVPGPGTLVGNVHLDFLSGVDAGLYCGATIGQPDFSDLDKNELYGDYVYSYFYEAGSTNIAKAWSVTAAGDLDIFVYCFDGGSEDAPSVVNVDLVSHFAPTTAAITATAFDPPVDEGF